MKGSTLDRENLLMLLAAFAIMAFLAAYMVHTDLAVFHIQSALLGVIMIAVAVFAFGKLKNMRLIIIGVVVLSLTHISELVSAYAGIGEYANGVIEHSLFFIGILLIMQGLFVLSKGRPATK